MKAHTVLIAAGAVLLIAAAVVWVVTDRQSVLMAMSAVFLMLTGALQGVQTPDGNGK